MALLDLPNETLHTIICCIPDAPSLLAMMKTCKRIYQLLSYATKNGAKLWELVRIKEGWPSPDLIDMTDHGFLRAYYGQGCDYCPSLTKTAPQWDFAGLRLCQDCILASTVCFDDLSADPQAWTVHAGVPFFHRVSAGTGRGKRKKWHELYLRNSIPGRAPTNVQIQAAIQAQWSVQEFRQALEENERKRIPVKPIITRRKIIDDIVKEMFPEIKNAGAYGDLKTYETAYNTYTVFTPRSQARFREKLCSEIEAKRAEITKKIVDYHAGYVVADCMAWREQALFRDLPAVRSAMETLGSQLERFPSKEDVTAIITPLVSTLLPAITDKIATQERWKGMYPHYPGYDDLLQLSLFKEGDPDREGELIEAMGKINKQHEVRDKWTDRYLVTPHLRNFGKATELFLAANETQEDEFQQMIADEQNREQAKQSEFARREFGNNTKKFIFYCTNCDYCLGAGANAKMMQLHFAISKIMCSMENLGIRDE